MCKVHNPVGSLTVIKTHLQRHKLDEYKSLKDLIAFQQSYQFKRLGIIQSHTLLVEQEKKSLGEKLAELDDFIKTRKTEAEKQLPAAVAELEARLDSLSSAESNESCFFVNYVKKNSLKFRIRIKRFIPDLRLARSLRPFTIDYNRQNSRYQYILTRFDDAVMQSGRPQLLDLDRRKNLIDQINSSIYGAQGEHKVVKELQKLPDDYILINDFTHNFRRYIYNGKGNDYIGSIQIDHILVAPSGIFIIETKNWSEYSLNDPTLFSPVRQVQRTNFALYRLLNHGFSNLNFLLNKWPWGKSKVPIRNLVVFINHKPARQYEYVKMLTLNELLGYVTYFTPCFSPQETQTIADYLLRL
ncbi:MAG TPA: nuclease-related domain-containing protein [Mucilaginibacter sp.]|jgi:hypothetical protein|nr:nuclease-related domain-containing protein [Mucilaginibacter sp.]